MRCGEKSGAVYQDVLLKRYGKEPGRPWPGAGKRGISSETGERLLDREVVRTVKTIMLTCGMYDGSGEFAVEVGIPSKSGVGGGILSVVDRKWESAFTVRPWIRRETAQEARPC